MKVQVDQEWRRARLLALSEMPEIGSKAELGRLLGATEQPSSFVGQLLSGRRPITENVVAKIEAARGGRYRGWFTRPKGGGEGEFTPLARLIAKKYDELPDGHTKNEKLAQILSILDAPATHRGEDASEVLLSRGQQEPAATSSLLTGDRLFVDAVRHAAKLVLESNPRGRRAAKASSASAPAEPKPTPKRSRVK